MNKMEKTYQRIEEEYRRYLEHRNAYIKRAFICLLVLPLLFLVFMFFLDSKAVFLVLWIISFILIAAFLTYQEYLDFYYRRLLNLDEDENEKIS